MTRGAVGISKLTSSNKTVRALPVQQTRNVLSFPESDHTPDTPFIVSLICVMFPKCVSVPATNAFYPPVAAGNVFQSHEFLARVPTENIPITVRALKTMTCQKVGLSSHFDQLGQTKHFYAARVPTRRQSCGRVMEEHLHKKILGPSF